MKLIMQEWSSLDRFCHAIHQTRKAIQPVSKIFLLKFKMIPPQPTTCCD